MFLFESDDFGVDSVVNHISARLSNELLRRRLRATQVLLTCAFVPATLARVAVPFIGWAGAYVLHAAFACNVVAAFLSVSVCLVPIDCRLLTRCE